MTKKKPKNKLNKTKQHSWQYFQEFKQKWWQQSQHSISTYLLCEQQWNLLKSDNIFSCQGSILKHDTQTKRNNNKHKQKSFQSSKKNVATTMQVQIKLIVCFLLFFAMIPKTWSQQCCWPIFFDLSSGLWETLLEILASHLFISHTKMFGQTKNGIELALSWGSCVKGKENWFST